MKISLSKRLTPQNLSGRPRSIVSTLLFSSAERMPVMLHIPIKALMLNEPLVAFSEAFNVCELCALTSRWVLQATDLGIL